MKYNRPHFYTGNNKVLINNIPSIHSFSFVELYNLIGQKIMKDRKYDGELKIINLEKGIYFLRIKNSVGSVYTGRVVKE